jgi:hypothetical protein
VIAFEADDREHRLLRDLAVEDAGVVAERLQTVCESD